MKSNLKYLLWSVMLFAMPVILLIALSERSAVAMSLDRIEASSSIFVDSNVSGLTAPVKNGAVAWADHDGDGDLDILLTGNTPAGPIAKIYQKNPDNSYYEVPNSLTHLVGVKNGAVAWGDYNNDGRPDILLTGQSQTTRISKVYRNEGAGQFTDIGANLPSVSDSSVAWGDYDNDGKVDILLAGDTGSGNITRIYHNDGDGTFTDSGVILPGISHGSVAWGDYNNDGRLDFLLTGLLDELTESDVSRIYRNDGNGAFTNIGALIGLQNSSAAWGDYNNDGKLDIVMTGAAEFTALEVKLYRNDGNGVFTAVDNTGLIGNPDGALAAWGDYDNDGKLDILMNGNVQTNTAVYRNMGADTFASVDSGLPAVESRSGSAAWGDYNGTGNLDVLITGQALSTLVTGIYSNTSPISNTTPISPTGLTATIACNSVLLRWSPASDDHTPSSGLTYNVRVGTTPGGSQIVSPLSIASSGYRQVPAFGNSFQSLSATLTNLQPGQYFWSVQAIDTSFAGSLFATEATFRIPYCSRLPLVMNNYTTYFEGPWESEPNNSRDEANGPIRSGQPYYGYPNDQKDYFSFYVSNPGTISMTLTNHTGQGVQFQLRYGDSLLVYDYTPPLHIEYAADQPGWYYAYIFTESGWNSTTPYTLIVAYPP